MHLLIDDEDIIIVDNIEECRGVFHFNRIISVLKLSKFAVDTEMWFKNREYCKKHKYSFISKKKIIVQQKKLKILN
jgi:hypothetical protein